MGATENPDRHPEIIVCAGSPSCHLDGDEAVAAQMAGCPICRRIICHPDGSETEYRVKAH
jgi:hypothetical protein